MKVKLHLCPLEDVVCETAQAQTASSVDKVSLFQYFQYVSIPHCFPSLLVFLFVASAVSEDMLCPRLLLDQIVPLTLVLSKKSNFLF